MTMKKGIVLGVLLICLGGVTMAQNAVEGDGEKTPLLKELTSSDWSFFVDKEQGVYFIDFELFKENLKEILVTDSTGKIVYHDELWDLPVNTIYELDFNKIGQGDFTIELHSYTHVYRKNLTVQ